MVQEGITEGYGGGQDNRLIVSAAITNKWCNLEYEMYKSENAELEVRSWQVWTVGNRSSGAK